MTSARLYSVQVWLHPNFFLKLLLLDEANLSGAVIVIVSVSAGWADGNEK